MEKLVLSRGREEHWVTVCRETLRCLWVAGLAQTLARARSWVFTILVVQCWLLQRNLGAQKRAALPPQGGHLCINTPGATQDSLAAMQITDSALPSNLSPPGLSRREPVQVWQAVPSGRSQQIPCFGDYLTQNFIVLGKNHPDPTRWSRLPLISVTSG